MKIRGLRTLKLSACWLRSRFTGGALILGYHRVAEPVWDPYGLCVSPHCFAQQLEAVRELANPIALPALVQALREGRVPPRAVAVTFDDGYADLLTHAKPLLERFEIPATVFVPSGYLGLEFWWDELARIVRPSNPLPASLALEISGQRFEWSTGGAENNPRRRKSLLFALYNVLLPLPETERQQALERIRSWASPSDGGQPDSRAMTPEELVELCADGLVDIGSHTATHPVLAALPPAVQQLEIHGSKTRLEELIRRPVTSFSYPNGSTSAQTSALVREAGFTCACASHSDVARAVSDPHLLPRFWIPDSDAVRFRRWLNRWLHGPVMETAA